MKIDITQPQPCPLCGAEMVQIINKFDQGASAGATEYWRCSESQCGMDGAALTVAELNRLALLTRLGEVVLFQRQVLCGLRDNRAYYEFETRRVGGGRVFGDCNYARFLICVGGELMLEHRAILAALAELEATE